MKRFVFRLARLERLREIERRQARARLALALGEEHRARADREAARALLDEAWARPPGDGGEIDARSLQALAAWREGRRSALVAADGRVEETARTAHEALARHTEAARHHRALERLRETRYGRWLDDERLEQSKFLDEIHQLRVARERGGTEAPTCER